MNMAAKRSKHASRNGYDHSLAGDVMSSVYSDGDINRKIRLKEAIELYQSTGNSQRLLDILSFSSSAGSVDADEKHSRRVEKTNSNDFVERPSDRRFSTSHATSRKQRSTADSTKDASGQERKGETSDEIHSRGRHRSERDSRSSSALSEKTERREKMKGRIRGARIERTDEVSSDEDLPGASDFQSDTGGRRTGNEDEGNRRREARGISKRKRVVLDLDILPKEIVTSVGFGFSIRGGAEYGFGIYVSNVLKNSVADLCGLAVGDRIMSINGVSFGRITSQDAAEVLRSNKRLEMELVRGKTIPGTSESNGHYIWVTPGGMPCSPPPDDKRKVRYETIGGSLKGAKNSDMILRTRDEKRVRISVRGSRKLGLFIRGGREYNLGIFVSGVEPGCLAAQAGIKVGDQILDANGHSFLDIEHDDAKRILASSKQLVLCLKEVGKVPYGMETYDGSAARTPDVEGFTPPDSSKRKHLHGHEISAETPFRRGVGSQLMLRQSSRSLPVQKLAGSSVFRKSRRLIGEGNFKLFVGYLKAYLSGNMELEDMVEHILPILNTEKKLSILGDLRSLIFARDLETYDAIVLSSGLHHVMPFEESRVSVVASTPNKARAAHKEDFVDHQEHTNPTEQDEWAPLNSALKEVFDDNSSEDDVLRPEEPQNPTSDATSRVTRWIQTESEDVPLRKTSSEAVQVCIDNNESINSLRAVEKQKRASMRGLLNSHHSKEDHERSEITLKDEKEYHSGVRDDILPLYSHPRKRDQKNNEVQTPLSADYLSRSKTTHSTRKQEFAGALNGLNSEINSSKMPSDLLSNSISEETDLNSELNRRATLPKPKFLRRKDNWVLMSPDVFRELNINGTKADKYRARKREPIVRRMVKAEVHRGADNIDDFKHASDSSYNEDVTNHFKLIEITKTRSILGIAITGGCDTEPTMPRVVDIQENGSAFHSELRKGDVLVEVDGIKFSGLDHEECAKLIVDCYRSNTNPTLKLLVTNAPETIEY